MISNLTTKVLSSLGPYLLVKTNKQGYQTKFDYQGASSEGRTFVTNFVGNLENLVYASFLLKDKDLT
jgi:hypothetical protein